MATYLGQTWLGQWLVAYWHQAITWTNVDFSPVRFLGIDMRSISQQVLKLLFCIMNLKSYTLKFIATFSRGKWVKSSATHFCEIWIKNSSFIEKIKQIAAIIFMLQYVDFSRRNLNFVSLLHIHYILFKLMIAYTMRHLYHPLHGIKGFDVDWISWKLC